MDYIVTAIHVGGQKYGTAAQHVAMGDAAPMTRILVIVMNSGILVIIINMPANTSRWAMLPQ